MWSSRGDEDGFVLLLKEIIDSDALTSVDINVLGCKIDLLRVNRIDPWMLLAMQSPKLPPKVCDIFVVYHRPFS